ncbi:SKA3 protein, partial [Polypterus senegalus]|nr:spindle and kinetochore-associated protein 3 [Polypterus senegalus]XP_039599951.1 spindle and kinetochore-associated protein 3 [Polypterus senegalus]MBN3291143.1 SKA3 protein [Polypterus senegalus]
MNITEKFFWRLRSLAVTLDTETEKIKNAYQNSDDDDHCEAGASQTLFELHSEVRGLKEEVQQQIAANKSTEDEISELLRSYCILKQRITADLERIKEEFQKYGYKPLSAQNKEENKASALSCTNSEKNVHREENENMNTRVNTNSCSESPTNDVPTQQMPRDTDVLRTPRLSAFGLSQYRFCKPFNPSEMKNEQVTVTSETIIQEKITSDSLCNKALPNVMRTPKLALNLDADAVTPPLRDFGIGEYSICDNDDFTIALMKKNKYINPKRTNEDFESIEAAGTCEAGTSADVSNSPLLPVFQTPGFKIASQKSPEKLSPEKKPSSTPEIPAFETPYFKKLIHEKKTEQISDNVNLNEKPQRAPSPPVLESKKYECTESSKDPPVLSFNTFQTNTANHLILKEPDLPVLTSQLSKVEDIQLRSPPKRSIFALEMKTPERPNFSLHSCALMGIHNQGLEYEKLSVIPTKPSFTSDMSKKEKENRGPLKMAIISEKEYLALPNHLRQVSLEELNRLIQRFNEVLKEKYKGNDSNCPETNFNEKELQDITGTGAKVKMYLFCLTELNRLSENWTPTYGSMYSLVLK